MSIYTVCSVTTQLHETVSLEYGLIEGKGGGVGWKGGEIKMEVGQRGDDVKKREEGGGKRRRDTPPEETQEDEMERLRRNGRGMERRGSLLPRDYGRERKRVRREGESKRVIALQQHLMASLGRGREGVERRRGHNEGL